MSTIKRVADVAQHVIDLQYQILNLETELKEKKKELRFITEFVLPDETDSLDWNKSIMRYDPGGDVVTINLPNGHILAIAEEFHPHTPKKDNEKREAILDWVEGHGGQDLLTLDVSLSFRRGEGKLARKVLAALDGIPEAKYTKEKGIHHALYQTFCRDLIRKGQDLPEMLGVFNRRVAKVAETQHSEIRKEHNVPEWTQPEKRRGVPAVKRGEEGYGE